MSDQDERERYRYLQLKQKMAAAKQQPPQPDGPGIGEALGRGALQGATLGFGDEIYGGMAGLGSVLSGGGDFGDTYTKARDEVRANNKAAQDAHSIAYGGGELAGSILPGLATGGLGEAAEGASLASRLGTAAKAGAAVGAANGLGSSDADNIRDLGKDTALGALAGGAAGGVGAGVGEALGAGVNKLKPYLDKGANHVIAKHVLSPEDFGSATVKGEIQDLGQKVFDNELTTPLSGRAEIARRANQALASGRQSESDILSRAPGIDTGKLQSVVKDEIVNPAYEAGIQKSVGPVESAMGDLGDGQMSALDFNKFKSYLQRAHDRTGDSPEIGALRQAAHHARVLEDANIADSMPGELPSFLQAKGKKMIGGKVVDGMKYSAQNSTGDLVKGMGAAALGGVTAGPTGAAIGAGTVALKHVADGRGTTMVAHAMKALGQKDVSKFRSGVSKALSRNPYFLGSLGNKLRNAMSQDAQDGGNETAKVGFESQGDPRAQAVLKARMNGNAGDDE